jgi:hypothetical protein
MPRANHEAKMTEVIVQVSIPSITCPVVSDSMGAVDEFSLD